MRNQTSDPPNPLPKSGLQGFTQKYELGSRVKRFVLTVIIVLSSTGAPIAAAPQPAATATPSFMLATCLVESKQDLAVTTGLVNAGLTVRFVNNGLGSYRRIVWRARYGSGWIDFNDTGRFDPGVSIANYLYIANRPTKLFGGPRYPFAPYQNLADPTDCTAVMTETTDGVIWQDASFTATPMSIPTTPPEKGTTVPAAYIAGQTPIGVLSCVMGYSMFGMYTSELQVRYQNLDSKALTQVTFRVPYSTGAFDYIDKSDIKPGPLISHLLRRRLPLPVNGYQTLNEAATCTVVNATYADGSTWKNPDVSQIEPSPPTQHLNQEFYVARGTGKWRNGAMP